MKEIMKYSGPRMIFSHPFFALSHVVEKVIYKRKLKNMSKVLKDKRR